ncbi:MAG: DNA translocase FtsK 4TM domain-containing protein [Alphaproteobacteria bacterium]
MPPSATITPNSPEYDAAYAQALMDEVAAQPSGTIRRAVVSLLSLAVGVFIVAAVMSYNPFDSTNDTAGIGPIQNVFGETGAGFANILMQSVGWGSVIFGALLVFLGLRGLVRPRPYGTRVDRFSRWLVGFGLVLFGTITLSAVPIPQSWPMATGLGGWIGDGFYLTFKAGLDRFNIPVSGLIVASFTFMAAAFFLARVVGIVGRDVLDIYDAAGLVWATFRVWVDKVAGAIHRRIAKSELGDHETAKSFDSGELIDPPKAKPKPKRRAKKAAKTNAAASESVIAKPAARKAPTKKKAKPKPENFHFPEGSDFVLPQINLLKTPPPRKVLTDEGALRRAAENLHRVMDEYGIKGEMGAVRPGPVVTLFEFEPAPGVKSQRVINLAPDIARNMSAESARIAVVPGRNAMGVEMPNRRRETVWLKDMLESEAFVNSDAGLPLIMGEDIGGSAFIADLSKMPHLLVAGTTGSGKSVAINAMILSLMYRLTPDECKFIMIDPKMLELSVYDGAPHLLAPVVTEPKKAVVALKWTVREMEDRYRKMSKMGVRNMAGYNEKVQEAKESGEIMTRTVMTGYDKESGDPVYETEELDFDVMPFIVVIIDEMADLMMVAGKDIEGTVQRLAQMARAAGIHMIMATQRPSVDVITGTIKANFPTRVSFRVGSSIDSRTILGETGAEHLLGNGDMLFMGTGRPRRLHGPFVSDGEVEKIANFVKAQGSPSYLEEITAEPPEESSMDGGGDGESNSLFDQAVAIVASDRKASTSYIQRRLSIGYNRAANLVERMESEGMIGPSGAGGKREIFLPEQGGY